MRSPFLVRLNPNGEVIWTQELDFSDDQRLAEPVFIDIRSLVRTQLDEVVACGTASTRADNNRYDAILLKFTSDILHAEFLIRTPEERDLWVMPGTSIAFEVRAEGDAFQGLRYEWFFEDSIIGRDAGVDVLFDSTGDFRISCHAEHNNNVVELDWMVHVRDLFIITHTPDTLSLTVQRNSESDFSLDSVAYIGDSENLRYEWMIYDSTAVRWEEVAGDDRIGIRSYAFNRTGGYALKAKVFDPNVDPIPADSIQWNIQVRGVIRAFEPNLPELFLEPRQEATFELIPFNANNDSIEFWWTLNEADTLSTQSTLSMSFQDTGRYVVSGYARERVSEDEWEEDVQVWVVNVHSLSAGLDPRLRGDDEGESGDDEGKSGDDGGGRRDDAPLSLTIAPNPFNDQATVTIDLGGRAFLPALRADKNVRPPSAQVGGLLPVRLSLYALDGREVLRLHDGPLSPGNHTFSLSHFSTFTLPSGIYFLRLHSGTHSRTAKAVLMR